MSTLTESSKAANVVKRKPVALQSKPEIQNTYTQLAVLQDQDGHLLRSSWNSLDLIADVILCLTPLSFVVLAGFALSLDRRPLSSLGSNIQAWALLSPTIFPLVFAAVIGRALTFFARLRLEQGSSLGVLEQLLGSQTVFGTIWVQVTLRNLNALGVVLVLLWLISPLGGQSSLRLIAKDAEVDEENVTFASLDPTNTTSSFTQGFAQTLSGASINALYVGCLVAPLSIKDGAQDTWGNVKIPTFETYNHTIDDGGYAKVPEDDVDWASLLGQPVAGLETRYDSNFTLRSWYHDLECSNLTKVPASSDWIVNIFGKPFASQNNASTVWDGGGGQSSSWLLHLVEDLNAYNPDKLKFVWLSKSGLVTHDENPQASLNYDETCLARCSMTVTHVEVQMACHGLSCRPSGVRKIPPPSNWAGSLLDTVGSSRWSYFYQNLIGTDTRSAAYTSSVTEQYIYGRVESPFQYGVSSGFDTPGYLDMTEVPLLDFTRRLRIILNTYFFASLAPAASTGTMASANATKLLSGEDRIQGGFYELGVMPVPATTSSSTDIYRCSKTFVALAIISSAILFVTGVAGVVAKYHCKGPDMLGYLTSTIRHNPYTPLHEHNGTLDTSELARQSKSLFLRLEDVGKATDNVGHIAISSLQKTSIRQARVQNPERSYK